MKKQLPKSEQVQEIHRLAQKMLDKDVLNRQQVWELDEKLKKVLAQTGQFKRYFRRLP